MNWEVIRDDVALLQVLKVKLLLKSLTNNGLVLTRVELIKHVSSVTLEWKDAVKLGKTTFNLQDFSHQVDDRVIEVKDNHHGISCALSFIEVFLLLNLVEDGVENATTADKRVELETEHLQRVCTSDDAIVRALVVSQLLLTSQVLVEFETIVVTWILEVIVLLDELFDSFSVTLLDLWFD